MMPRTSLDTVNQLTAERLVRQYVDGILINTSSSIDPFYHRNELRVTVNTPNFRDFRVHRSGSPEDLPMNPFTYTLDSKQFAYGQVTEEKETSLTLRTGVLAFGENFIAKGINGPIRTAIQDQALNKSLKDLKDQKVNLGVMFGERKKTGQLILDSAKNLIEGYRNARRGDLSGAIDALSGNAGARDALLKKKNVTNKLIKRNKGKPYADLWLQLQYGWKPLLNDVYNSAEALARQSNRPQRFRVSSSKSHRWILTDYDDQYQGLPVRRVETGIFTRKYVYVFSYSNEVIHSLSELGITNPASIAWELLPFSFVADWFVGIGNYLDVLDATLGLTFEKGCVTDFERLQIRYKGVGAGLIPETGVFVRHNFGAFRKYVNVSRGQLSSFPSPSLPKFDFTPRSVSHGITFAALLSQQFSRVKGARL